MSQFASLLYVCLLLPRSIIGQFVNPPPPDGGQSSNPQPSQNPTPDFSQNLVWPIGSTQTLKWTADVSTYHLRLYQRFVSEQFPDINGYTYSAVGNGSGDQSFAWNVFLGPGYTSNTGFSDSASEVFFFEIDPVQTGAEIIQSHYINITGTKSNNMSPSSASTPLPTAMGGPVSTLPGPSNAGATSSSTSNSATVNANGQSQSQSTSASGFSQTAKVGLGVGLGVGIPVILLLGILVGLRISGMRKNLTGTTAPGNDGSTARSHELDPNAIGPQELHSTQKVEMPSYYGRPEMESSRPRHEMAERWS